MASCVRYAREAITIARELDHVPTLLHTLFWSTNALLFVSHVQELAEAEQLGDRGRANRAREELEAVAEQLAAAVGL